MTIDGTHLAALLLGALLAALCNWLASAPWRTRYVTRSVIDFARRCDRDEYTDTGEAWQQIRHLYEALTGRSLYRDARELED